MIYHYWFFNHGFEFQNSVCNVCHDLAMLSANISDIAIITIKNIDYRCILSANISDIAIITIKNIDYPCIMHSISKYKAINLSESSVLEDCGDI